MQACDRVAAMEIVEIINGTGSLRRRRKRSAAIHRRGAVADAVAALGAFGLERPSITEPSQVEALVACIESTVRYTHGEPGARTVPVFSRADCQDEVDDG